MTETPLLRVFFSHSSRDVEWVTRVAAQATAAGVKVYLAEHDVSPGRRLSEKITNQIENCDAMIVLLSENSLTSVYVQQEIGLAKHAGKLVIPILMDGVAGADLGMLNDHEYISLDPSFPQNGLVRLSQTLSSLIDHQRQQLEANALSVEAEMKHKQEVDLLIAGGVLLVIGLIIISQNGK